MSRDIDTAGSSPRFTRLDTVVMAALAHDLRRTVPDLARQFAASRPGRRRNTAFGYYAGMADDRPRSGAEIGLTGRFGTVHAMIPPLPESVAFQVELLNGRLLALHADSYGQDTRGLDFVAAQPTEVFTLDEAGRSIPFSAVETALEAPRRAASLPVMMDSNAAPPTVFIQPPARTSSAPSPSSIAPQQAQDDPRRASSGSAADFVFGRNPTSDFDDIPAPEDQKSLLLGLWVAIAAIAIVAALLFHVPVFFALFAAFFVGRSVQNPKVLNVIASLLKQAQEQQALNAQHKP